MHAPASPTGLWRTANGNAVVEIDPCGPDICGRIVGLALAPDAAMPKAWTGAPQCGLTIFRTAPQEDGAGRLVWTGTILDPRNGAQYGAKIAVPAAGELQLRGYLALPIFGQTQTWTAYHGPAPEHCRVPAPSQND